MNNKLLKTAIILHCCLQSTLLLGSVEETDAEEQADVLKALGSLVEEADSEEEARDAKVRAKALLKDL